jgi:dienelactone hydrolase
MDLAMTMGGQDGQGDPKRRETSRSRRSSSGASTGRRTRVALFVLALLAVMLVRPAARHARAASLLASFSDPNAKPAVLEEDLSLPVPGRGAVPARIYRPASLASDAKGMMDAPGVVLVHGVHRLGIAEPRLQRFARAVADAGLVVMTPEVSELSDYHVASRSIDTVGAATLALAARLGRKNVGLMGMSFGGGVALLTAADARFADRIAFVVAVGAHDDLARVSRFFATNEIAEADGGTLALHAHEYGATVLVYSHVEDFFPEADVPAARDALRLWLWEKRDDARAIANKLSPASKEKVEKLFAADLAPVRQEILAEIDRHVAEMGAVSPHGHLAGLRAHVYLMHGAGDTVIPASETLWLAKDVPPALLRAVLVSPAIVHVELKEPTLLDKWELVHFMGRVIGEAEDD